MWTLSRSVFWKRCSGVLGTSHLLLSLTSLILTALSSKSVSLSTGVVCVAAYQVCPGVLALLVDRKLSQTNTFSVVCWAHVRGPGVPGWRANTLRHLRRHHNRVKRSQLRWWNGSCCASRVEYFWTLVVIDRKMGCAGAFSVVGLVLSVHQPLVGSQRIPKSSIVSPWRLSSNRMWSTNGVSQVDCDYLGHFVFCGVEEFSGAGIEFDRNLMCTLSSTSELPLLIAVALETSRKKKSLGLPNCSRVSTSTDLSIPNCRVLWDTSR